MSANQILGNMIPPSTTSVSGRKNWAPITIYSIIFWKVCMAILTIGERLDGEGNPIPGTGFEYDSEGEVAELIAQRASPILYTPGQNEWVWGLDVSDESNGEFDRFVAVCPAGNQGTITHYHPNFDELFKGVSGTFLLEADGEEVILEAGEEFMVKRGVVHSFRCVGDVLD